LAADERAPVSPLLGGDRTRGPPAAQLELAALLNAVFEIVAGASQAYQLYPLTERDRNRENTKRGTFAQFQLSRQEWEALNLERARSGEPLITLAHWMILGEEGGLHGRGIGLRGLQ